MPGWNSSRVAALVCCGFIGGTATAGCAVGTRLIAAGRGASGENAAKIVMTPDDGMTGEIHARYVGQIVFASSIVPKDAPDEQTFAAEFYDDETLYGRVYMPHSVENHPVYLDGGTTPTRNSARGYFFKLFVDGEQQSWLIENQEMPDSLRTATTYQVWLHPDPKKEPTDKSWIDLVQRLSTGPHTVRVELWTSMGSYRSREALAAGEFILHKTSGTALGIGKTFADYEIGMADAALGDQLLGIAQDLARRKGWKESLTAARISSTDWGLVRNKYTGLVVKRQVSAWIRGQWPDGKCTAQALLFEQNMLLERPQGEIYHVGVGRQDRIDCAERIEIAVVDRWAGRARQRPIPTGTAPAQQSPQQQTPQQQTPQQQTPQQQTPQQQTPQHVAVTVPRPAVQGAAPAATVQSAAVSRPTDATFTAEQSAIATRQQVPAASPRRFSLGIGMAGNARSTEGVASYAHAGVHLGRVELGAGATWPLNALGYLRVNLLSSRLVLGPMIGASVMAEADDAMDTAIAAGMTMAYPLFIGSVQAGVRIDALLSYNLEPAQLALPILGSTYLRF